jgi:catechol 2,3-dioxygenase-like lactoylglutathione lyase family enzyme
MSDVLANKSLGAITLFTEDLPATKAFYQDVFGLTIVNEDEDAVAFRFGTSFLNVLKVEAAPELIAPAKVAAPQSGSRVQLTIWVDDVDAMCAELATHSVTLLNGPINRPWGPRTAAFTDPAGHIWELAGGAPET